MLSQLSKIPGGNELMNNQKVLETAGIEEGMVVADLGCGARGYFALQAGKMVGKNGLVYAVDILKPSLQSVESIARLHNIQNIKTVWSDLEIHEATKIKSESVDFALLINVLFQSKKQEAILKETARLLKNQGKLLVVDWKKTGAPFGPPIEDRILPEQVKEWAEEMGLKLEKEFEAGPYHYGLVFTKV